MLAGISKTPELALEKSESDAIADATAKVAEHYDVVASPKIIAWCNLTMCLGAIYGTRFIAINARKKMERTKRSEKVSPIRPGVNVGTTGIPQVTMPDWNTDPIGPDGKPTKQ